MNLSKVPGRLSRLITDNSPVILTALGVAGVATTAYLTGKASYRAANIIYENSNMAVLSKREKFDLVWKLYIPAASAGVMTCTCVVLSNRIGTRRAAAVAAALTLGERAFDEYRAQIVETLGEKKEEIVRGEIAKKRLEKNPPTDATIILAGGDVLIMDAYSGRVFKSDKEKVRKAENDINRAILREDSQTVSDFYDLIGLDHTSVSDEFGWNVENKLELGWSTAEWEGQAVLSFDFLNRPILRPWRFV